MVNNSRAHLGLSTVHTIAAQNSSSFFCLSWLLLPCVFPLLSATAQQFFFRMQTAQLHWILLLSPMTPPKQSLYGKTSNLHDNVAVPWNELADTELQTKCIGADAQLSKWTEGFLYDIPASACGDYAGPLTFLASTFHHPVVVIYTIRPCRSEYSSKSGINHTPFMKNQLLCYISVPVHSIVYAGQCPLWQHMPFSDYNQEIDSSGSCILPWFWLFDLDAFFQGRPVMCWSQCLTDVLGSVLYEASHLQPAGINWRQCHQPALMHQTLRCTWLPMLVHSIYHGPLPLLPTWPCRAVSVLLGALWQCLCLWQSITLSREANRLVSKLAGLNACEYVRESDIQAAQLLAGDWWTLTFTSLSAELTWAPKQLCTLKLSEIAEDVPHCCSHVRKVWNPADQSRRW